MLSMCLWYILPNRHVTAMYVVYFELMFVSSRLCTISNNPERTFKMSQVYCVRVGDLAQVPLFFFIVSAFNSALNRSLDESIAKHFQNYKTNSVA